MGRQHRGRHRRPLAGLPPGGYIGDSTRREIDYARSLGKPIRYTHPATETAPRR
ncbi:hypothetical protein [Streptomyces cellulosae]|uniref:Uncharacterized protein n=1 Tax=Streptomyces cellulosae TaxID=1968 RepID=A0ABW7Y6L9_STRCE